MKKASLVLLLALMLYVPLASSAKTSSSERALNLPIVEDGKSVGVGVRVWLNSQRERGG